MTKLRVVLFTRGGRPSGAQMAWRLVQDGMWLAAVVVEERSRMNQGGRKNPLFLLLKLGFGFLWKRICELAAIKIHFYLRKLLGEGFKNPVYLSIEEWALDHPSVPLFRVRDHNGSESVALLNRLKPDVGVLTNTRRIKSEILQTPRHGFLNLHLSALPQYAGLDSIFWALYHGEKEIGVTVHFAVAQIDRGDIVAQKKILVSPFDNEESLYEKALWLGTHLMTVALKQLEEGILISRTQDLAQASYFSWPSPNDRQTFKKRWRTQRLQLFSREGPSILHLITRMTRGGAQENTLVTALGLRAKGYPVTLVTGPSWGEEGEILSKALEEGLEVVILPELVREIDFFKDLIAFLKLRSWLALRPYVIIHTHTSKAGFLGRWAAHLSKTPAVVHTPHGHVFHSYFWLWKEKFFLALERHAAQWADRLIALTNRCRDEHLNLGVGTPEKWLTIPSGVEEKGFRDESQRREETLYSLGIPLGRKMVGFIGRLAPVKGACYLIEALPAIRKTVPEAHCLLVGDGEDKDALKKQARRLGLERYVTFAGHQETVSRFLSICDVLVVSSLNEGMGRVIVEGGFLRKPVVGTDVGGIPDLIIEGETGLLVEPRNAFEIAGAVIKILKNPVWAAGLGERLQTRVLNGFTADQMVEKINCLYQELLLEKGIFKAQALEGLKEGRIENESFR